jgi:hypothetical protein
MSIVSAELKPSSSVRGTLRSADHVTGELGGTSSAVSATLERSEHVAAEITAIGVVRGRLESAGG